MAKAKQIKEAAAAVAVVPKTSKKKIEAVRAGETSAENRHVKNLPINAISVSEFTPQWHRRKRFKPEDLTELAESIKNQGLINPITVRPREWKLVPRYEGEGFDIYLKETDTRIFLGGSTKEEAEKRAFSLSHEIVAGERRFEAAKLAGLDSILCFARELTDEQALEIQLQENLQRVDVDPLDEAFSYKYLMDEKKMTVADLMVKFGKSEKYITLRLKLNNLIPEVLQDIADGYLSLGHAVEIAKLDELQQLEALGKCFDTSWTQEGWKPDKTKSFPLREVLKKISAEVLLDLSKALFSTKDKRLRPDGLICPKCPQRTGAKNSLFEEFYEASGKSDRCLNPQCFALKTNRFIQITRDEATAAVKAKVETTADYKIQALAMYPKNKEELESILGTKVLTSEEYVRIHDTDNACNFAIPAVFLDGYSFGETRVICFDKQCEKHYRAPSEDSAASIPGEKSEAEKKKFYERKQEIFDIKVGEPVRRQTFREAAQNFTGDKWIFEDEKWRLRLVVRLWSKIDDNARAVITEVLGREKNSISPGYEEESRIRYFSENFTAAELSRILFLSIVANEGEMLWGSWRDQKGVLAVAEEFNVNYALLDAKERVVAAPKKFKDAATEHLVKIERGETVARPVFYKL